jgi:uptake hydrogenase large subunit
LELAPEEVKMATKVVRSIPLNRVEGDLEIKVEITDGVVTDAWSAGIMYRGFERIMVGRGPLDGLVITPRICGLCSVCHLKAAARALEMIGKVSPPEDAIRVRNVVNMTEHIQSDTRHGLLMFFPDFASNAYSSHSMFKEAEARYEPFVGTAALETIRETKKLLEIIAILGGQWPHTSFIVPGGIASIPSEGDIMLCRTILKHYRKWYEEKVLGCSLERWAEIRSLADLEAWLNESESNRQGDVGFYLRFAQEAGLAEIGKGHGNFLSFGALDMPENSAVAPLGKGTKFVPSGFAIGTRAWWFDQGKITEEVASSWFEDYPGGLHPFSGETKPYASGYEGKKYSWAKAPRYDGHPAETGPLAEMVVGENPLFIDLVAKQGPSVFSRELARLIRTVALIPAMDTWLQELTRPGAKLYYQTPKPLEDGEGFGLTEAARGSLGHWVKIKNGKIAHYQIITPTSWNGSPRDGKGVRGPWEEALIGVKVHDFDNPVEIGHVIRSFDSCMVCCVHRLEAGKDKGKVTL